MRFLTLLPTLLLFTLGYALPQPQNDPASQFMGVKVVRIPTGPSTHALVKLKDLIAKHNLELWTSTPTISSHVDVEVPPADYAAFSKAVQELQTQAGILEPVTIMHEDLGKSILEESSTSEEYAARMMKAGKFLLYNVCSVN